MKVTDQAAQTTLSLLQELFGSSPVRNFAVRLWDGTLWQPEPAEATRLTLVLQHPGALRSMFLPPTELNWAEAYVYNDVDFEGDINALFPLADQFIYKQWGAVEQLRYGARLLSLPRTSQPRNQDPTKYINGALHSKERDRQAVTYHYNQSNEFYGLFLDSRMIYTGAYFTSPDEDLESAQVRKLEYICRKLHLQPGERVLDIGCGWGAFALYATQHYGVEVDAVTLSEPQASFGQQRVAEAGLSDRCRIQVRDYRDVLGSNVYDKIASIGMFEHVGEKLLPGYFKQAYELLKPGGLFFNHGISSATTLQPNSSPTFANHYVFPDGEMVPITTTLRIAEESGFETRDLECLREHYTLTCRHWVQRLEAHEKEAIALTNEVTYRVWRLFMAALAHNCEISRDNIYQAVFAKLDHGHANIALTRSAWYA